MSTAVKIVNKSEKSKMLFQSSWLIEKTVSFQELIIRERAELSAPSGKMLTMLVNGTVTDIKPGTYTGRVILKVSEPYATRTAGLMQFNDISCLLPSAICVENGGISAEKSIPEAIWGGSWDEKTADNIYVAAAAGNFNGVIADDSDYVISNSRFDFEGFGPNDFAGAGSAVAAYGNSNVILRDSEINLAGVTRCAVHAGGSSRVTVENCDISNISPDSGWLGRFSWQISLKGTNRLCQLTDNAQAVYKNCRLKSNGWGILSIDGSDEFVKLTVKDSFMELAGPRSHGYGAFCIGPNEVVFDNTAVDVCGFPLMLMGMAGRGRAGILNGSRIRGRKFGVMINSDDNSILDIKDSDFDTGSAVICAKGSATVINIENCTVRSGRKLLMQLADSEECGMDMVKYRVPVGIKDTPIEGRDLTSASPGDDIFLNLKDMTVEGDILNSTTNIRAYRTAVHGGMGAFHDTLVGPVGFTGPADDVDGSAPAGADPERLKGPKNVAVSLKNVTLRGAVSSAVQRYREGVTEITPENWHELTNITQIPAEPVNNGVILSLDKDSVWEVTGKSYLTSLTIEPGAKITGAEGAGVSMTVNGVKAGVLPGEYRGVIAIDKI